MSKGAALLSSGIAMFLVAFMGSAANVALPSIGRDLGTDAVALGWIATVYLLSAGMLSVPVGRMADLWGRKKMFLLGIGIYCLGSFLSGLAQGVGSLMAYRFLQGAGGSMIFSTAVAILTSVFPPGERGKALGINTSCVYIGLSVGPFLGGILTENLGWRSIFLINVPIGLFVLLLATVRLKGEWAEAKGEEFDLVGSALYALMILLFIYGLIEGKPMALALGGVFLILFLLYEERAHQPVVELALFKTNPTFSLSTLAALLNYAATFGVSFLMSLYLQHVKALTPQQAGLVLVSQPLTMAALAPLAGWLSDRIEPRVVASSGMALTALSLGLFATIGLDTPLPRIVLALIFLGFGLALFSSPNTNAIMSSVKGKFYGLASAMVSTARLIGQLMSMALVTLILSLFVGKNPLGPSTYPLFLKSSRSSYILLGGLCVIGIFASLGRGKIHGEVNHEDGGGGR